MCNKKKTVLSKLWRVQETKKFTKLFESFYLG